ncbi:MAG: FAD:protein FMN transferase [Acidimicrobiales bacterium]
MGTEAHLMVRGGTEALLNQLEGRLQELEGRWSRFIDSSEICAINAAPDRWHVVSADTAALIQRSIVAWSATHGALDPTVLGAVEVAGYRTSFEQLSGEVPSGAATPAPGCAQIEVDSETRLVKLGPGTRFDPGAIGKGLAADLLAHEALQAGATGSLINIGGDIACRGAASDGGWTIELFEPTVAPEPLAMLRLGDGAVATSTTRKRTWSTADGLRHHVLDPRTGRSTTGPALATVIAAEAWFAEAVATQLLVDGANADIDEERAAAIVVDQTGAVHRRGDVRRFEW